MEILKVSSKSNPSKVAGAIANVFRIDGTVELQTIGAGSLNQAIKAIAIAYGIVTPEKQRFHSIKEVTIHLTRSLINRGFA